MSNYKLIKKNFKQLLKQNPNLQFFKIKTKNGQNYLSTIPTQNQLPSHLTPNNFTGPATIIGLKNPQQNQTIGVIYFKNNKICWQFYQFKNNKIYLTGYEAADTYTITNNIINY